MDRFIDQIGLYGVIREMSPPTLACIHATLIHVVQECDLGYRLLRIVRQYPYTDTHHPNI